MDRRRFLQSLAALGASIPAAALAGRPSHATLAGWPLHATLDALCDALEVPEATECDRADVAVARLLLGGIQDALPSWRTLSHECPVVARPVFPKRLDGTPVFEPVHVATIYWATSGPGDPWPEACHVTAVPELGMQVVTASRDSEDLWGCTDHALAWTSLRIPPHEVARAVLRTSWLQQRDRWEQDAWEEVLEASLLDEAALVTMRDAVWPQHDPDDDEGDHVDDPRETRHG